MAKVIVSIKKGTVYLYDTGTNKCSLLSIVNKTTCGAINSSEDIRVLNNQKGVLVAVDNKYHLCCIAQAWGEDVQLRWVAITFDELKGKGNILINNELIEDCEYNTSVFKGKIYEDLRTNRAYKGNLEERVTNEKDVVSIVESNIPLNEVKVENSEKLEETKEEPKEKEDGTLEEPVDVKKESDVRVGEEKGEVAVEKLNRYVTVIDCMMVGNVMSIPREEYKRIPSRIIKNVGINFDGSERTCLEEVCIYGKFKGMVSEHNDKTGIVKLSCVIIADDKLSIDDVEKMDKVYKEVKRRAINRM